MRKRLAFCVVAAGLCLSALLSAPRAEALPPFCYMTCKPTTLCTARCTDESFGGVITCGDYGICAG